MEGEAPGEAGGEAGYRPDSVPQISAQIVNVVASVNVGCDLDLKHVCCKAWNVEYDPQAFNGLKMRMREPNTTALIFSSGKAVITGAQSEADSRLACRKMARILRNVGYTVKLSEWTVQNCVAAAKMPFPVSLERLHVLARGSSGMNATYEPERSIALTIWMIAPHKMTFRVFRSGKVVILGFQKRQELDEGFQHVVPLLTECRLMLSAN